MTKYFLTDIDDCVLNWNNSFSTFVKEKKGLNKLPIKKTHNIGEWLSVPNSVAHEWIMEFNSSIEFANLPPHGNSDLFLPKIKEQGYSIIGITNCSNNKKVVTNRKENLQKIFGDLFSEVFCMPLSFNKELILRQYSGGYWVEDSAKWAEMGITAGHDTFLMKHPHNEEYTNTEITFVESWGCIFKCVR